VQSWAQSLPGKGGGLHPASVINAKKTTVAEPEARDQGAASGQRLMQICNIAKLSRSAHPERMDFMRAISTLSLVVGGALRKCLCRIAFQPS